MTSRQLAPSRRTPRLRRPPSLIGSTTELLSLDLFGLALDRLVIDPADVHRLVALSLAQGGASVAGVYPALRYEAEQRAANEARVKGRRTIGLADIAEHLEAGLSPLLADPRSVARLAVEREVALELRLSQPSGRCRALVEEAAARGIPVAFVADTYLPRDLIALMLRSAGLPAGIVLVSSHEGVTKYNGGLFRQLAQRTGIEPARILHLGPDPAVDVVMAERAGLQAVELASPVRDATVALRRGLWSASALDSVALALSARQQVIDADANRGGANATGAEANEPTADPALGSALDLGYCVGGPLATGFVAWAGSLIDQRQPRHVVLCGRAGPLVRDLLLRLRPDLAANRLHLLPETGRPGASAVDPSGPFDRLATSMRLTEGDRILAVELGWPDLVGLALSRAVNERYRRVEVQVAAMGRARPALAWERDVIWAFSGAGHDPTTELLRGRLADLEAMLGLDPHGSARGGELYRRAAPAITEGINRFAGDLAPWFRLDPAGTSPALTGPAIRVLEQPSPFEASLLADFRVDFGPGFPTAGPPAAGSPAATSCHQAPAGSAWSERTNGAVRPAGRPSGIGRPLSGLRRLLRWG